LRREGGKARVLQGAFACLLPLALAACEGTSLLKTESLKLAVTPANIATNFSSAHTEGTVEIYSRVARGAKACWFGTGKPLEASHVFEGKLEPESEGGAAEVAVHIRTSDQPNPRGGKVFIVSITKEGEGTSLVTESRRLPDALANSLRADVAKWARTGSVECGALAMPENQVAAGAPPLPERKPAVKRAKGKAKGKK
jgi:hypothetical protein